jgi:hypothetical protein
MTHIDAIGSTLTLEEQLDDLIKNANKEEDKERFKALKALTNYYKPSQIRTSIDHYADRRYDLTINLIGCCK